jgi:hypothetical protein
MKLARPIYALTCFTVLAFASSSLAQALNCYVGTDSLAINPSPPSSRPGYFAWFIEPTYAGAAVRVAADSGTLLAPAFPDSQWKYDARHHYSKDQPWSADGSLLAIHNTRGAASAWLYLDGNTYGLLDIHNTPGINYSDWRWHPTQADVQIVVDHAAKTLYWTNVRTHAQLWSFNFAQQLPAFSASDGIGSFEGNPSNDGKFLALSDAATTSGTGQPVHVMIVKMNSSPVAAAVSTIPDPNLFDHTGKIGWLSVAPDGKELVVKYAAQKTDLPPGDPNRHQNDDCIRVFDIDTDSTSLTYLQVAHEHAFCGSFGPGTPPVNPCPYIGCGKDNAGFPLSPMVGWVYPLKHADMMMDGTTPILVGINGCDGIGDESNRLGRILRVDLLTGAVWRLSTRDVQTCTGTNGIEVYCHEPPAMHVSCRNSARPGWAYVTYDQGVGKRFSDEIVAVRIDSTGSVERFAHTHSEPDSVGVHFLDAEPQAVPSRDGGRVLWASNWNRDCSSGCGPKIEFKAYVLDATCGGHFLLGSLANRSQSSGSDSGAPGTGGPVLLKSLPNPFTASTSIQFDLLGGAMVSVDLFDAQGRRVAQLTNRYFLPGRHVVTWDHRDASGALVRPGVYLCRLTSGSFRDQNRLVLLP